MSASSDHAPVRENPALENPELDNPELQNETPENAAGGFGPGGFGPGGFRVRLANFEGPFDLLLNLISQHRLDVTQVALHAVTDDFIAYTRTLGEQLTLEQTTEFLVVAATLLDLKAARLLPAGEVDDAEDLALLEARDLLFARLLQYRAYKQVAQLFGELEAAALQRYPRAVSLEDRFNGLLPEVTLGVDAARFAEIAAAALTPRPVPTVGLGHLHVPKVSVPAQARVVMAMLIVEPGTWLTFGEIVSGCDGPYEVIGRFLGLLELFRERAIAFEQPEALGELKVSWTGERAPDEVNLSRGEEDYE
ncbi:segregation/condensation protein A [Gordonia pseudamarae]|jgi:segregation and condensation protein A|uniref:Segregation and condensation protein A n=1 Tax=Gordonia pseudamarae TaxID=2831662 RepID=A0ABX6IJU1_9ACTN|nr:MULTISPECIES: segregation/condensation protein A [Gordonia]MBD0024025.1 segregation/condensation protein A [Gordonia sp. (in: high G+C Gram-positive bacteria)]QHN26667.1 segregation/condensation protein A [Gordonia pseudamarae]QHN35560.1 segregation/condensation protein A [Gordonia pseudamarae]